MRFHFIYLFRLIKLFYSLSFIMLAQFKLQSYNLIISYLHSFYFIYYLIILNLEQREEEERFQCKEHPHKKVESFCSSPSCMKPVCILCIDEVHKNHDFKPIEKAFDIYRYFFIIFLFYFHFRFIC